jgi:hypothetical protein
VALAILILLAAYFLLQRFALSGVSHTSEPQMGCGNQTLSGECSGAKPYYCDNGTLLYEPLKCGCDAGLRAYGDTCIKSVACQDGTLSPDCSTTKPYLCQNGVLVENVSACGCPDGTIPDNSSCVDIYMTDPVVSEFPYTLDGQSYNLTVTLYGGLNDFLSIQNGYEYEYYSNNVPSSEELESDVAEQVMDQPDQGRLIDGLVTSIENITADKDDQARIAVSIVQNIQYDWSEVNSDSLKYPYQVLYTDSGICEDKSELLALLLKKLGFGVALFEFSNQDHEAVGINCSAQYSLDNSGYCFIETTTPNIITYSTGTYIGNVTLGPPTDIIPISAGLSFNASRDYADALEYGKLVAMGSTLDQSDYTEWVLLSGEYGLEVENATASVPGPDNACPAGSTYCNGLCWQNQCGEYQLEACTTQGLQCDYDPNDCPPGMHSCDGNCWQGCSRGSWRCTPQGGVCYE